ncbi:MAG: VWA domain-containing protein, partial [Algicola sp.]|nr:VWA domain-containing protein [Algicola sp.]
MNFVKLNSAKQLLTATLLLCSSGSFAAALLTPANSNLPALAIKEHHVEVVIADGYAITSIKQIFHNPNTTDLEANYSFEIPENAVVGEFTYWIDGQPVTGEVIEKAKARTIYEEEKQAGRETAIAAQDSYKTFDISVYPVRAKQDVKTRLTYIQPAHVDTGIGRYVYPLEDGGVDEQKHSFWHHDDAVTEKFSFNLLFRSSYPIDSLRLPKHPQAQISQISDKQWSVKMANNVADMAEEGLTTNAKLAIAHRLDQDIVVYWRHAQGLPGSVDLVTYKPHGSDEGTFMMTITPGEDLAKITEGRDWNFVLDYSGSMKSKYHSLIEGVRKGLHKLKSNDRFRIILFNSSAVELTQGYVAATDENVTKYITAMESYQPNMGTNLYAGLKLGIQSLDADRSSAVILITDGVANVGLTEKKAFIKLLQKQDTRLFTFIMGNNANRPLLQEMAKVSNGFSMNVSNSDDIFGKLMEATSKLTHEALHDVKVKFSGVKVADLSTEKVGSLYRGQQLIIFGHYWGAGEAHITIDGKVSGTNKSYSSRFDFPQESVLYPELERLWAYATIENLQNQLDYYGQDADIEQAITDLAIDKGLVTAYTSMIVLREEEYANRGINRRNAKR